MPPLPIEPWRGTRITSREKNPALNGARPPEKLPVRGKRKPAGENKTVCAFEDDTPERDPQTGPFMKRTFRPIHSHHRPQIRISGWPRRIVAKTKSSRCYTHTLHPLDTIFEGPIHAAWADGITIMSHFARVPWIKVRAKSHAGLHEAKRRCYPGQFPSARLACPVALTLLETQTVIQSNRKQTNHG